MPTRVTDLSSLTALQGFIIKGDAGNDIAGFSVSTAGDVNGDGIDDVIVGAPWGDDGGDASGEAYVIYGKAGPTRDALDLTALTTAQGFVIQGDKQGDRAGLSVDSAGDVNGDGIDDLIVGSPGGDRDFDFEYDNSGEAYVIYGVAGSARGKVDLTALTAAQGFIIWGEGFYNQAGSDVTSAGDVNGDGFDDLIVGASLAPHHHDRSGKAYVIYGQAGNTREVIDLRKLNLSEGFIIVGDEVYDYLGGSLSSAGDVNNDGIDDLIVGVPFGDDGGRDAGEAYVIYGQAGATRESIRVHSLTAAQGFLIQGDAESYGTASSVSSAGDVNGDGIEDLIVGAPWGDDGGTDAGEAYVIYGVAGDARGKVDLATLTPDQGFIIQGVAAGDRAGIAVSSAGDVNGDGIDDLIVGASRGDSGGIDAGEAYVIYGVAGNSRGRVDLATLAPDQGFMIQGSAAGDQAGFSVSSAGDMNGDGIDDLIVGAPFGDDGGIDADQAYVIYGGSASGFGGVVDLPSLQAPYGLFIEGEAAGALLRRSVSSAGDLNGVGDLIVGAPSGEDGGADSGRASVIFGQTGSTRPVDLSALTAGQGFIIQGDAAGFSVSSAGDVNGDGIDDLILGARLGNDGGANAGAAYVIYGVTGARGPVDLSVLTTGQGFIIEGDAAGDAAGFSVSSAGDVNGDGVDDLIVGAPSGDDGGADAGEAYVIFGAAGRDRGTLDLTELTPLQGFVIQGDQTKDRAGWSVSSAGDMNGDGIDDLIVGVPYGDSGGTDAGEAYVIYGRRPTLAVERIGTDIGQTIFGSQWGDTLSGLGGSDRLDGGEGNDTLNGGTGNDMLIGGIGNDFYVVDTQGDLVIEGAGGGTLDRLAASVSYVLGAGVQVEQMQTTSSTGTNAINLTGNALAQSIIGNAGANRLEDGRGAADTLTGGMGNDTYLVRNAGTQIAENAPNGTLDIVFTSVSFALAADDYIEQLQTTSFAGTDAINLTGNALAQRIVGNAGTNRLEDGAGAGDTLIGGAGNDTYVVHNASTQISEIAGQGTADTVVARTSYALAADDDIEILSTTDFAGTAAINLTGNMLAQRILGNSGANRLEDGLGAADTLVGGAGNDTYVVRNSRTRIEEIAGQGAADRVAASTSFALAADDNIEILSTTNVAGTTAINLTGNALAQRIVGNAGANRLEDGLGAADTLIGGLGDDTYVVHNASTQIVENASEGTLDFVFAAVSFALAADANIEQLQTTSFAGTSAINLTGNALAQRIFGNAGANRLEDGAGAGDTLVGDAGNDTYVVHNASTQIVEIAGKGTADTVAASTSFALAADDDIEILTTTNFAGTTAINLTGNALAQTIVGNAGANRLEGVGFGDTLVGGAGNDTYVVRDSRTRIDEFAGQGTADTVAVRKSFALAADDNIEILSTTNITGTTAVNLTGNALSQRIVGNAGANRLEDGAGVGDTLVGGAGNDTYVVHNESTEIVEIAGQGLADAVLARTSFALAADDNIELLRSSFGTTAINLTGNALAQRIFGNAGANRLEDGLGAADTLVGGAGNDTYVVRNSGTRIEETAGQGTADRVAASTSFALAADDNIEILSTTDVGGTTAINLTGNARWQHIIGNAGANQLDGGAGSDTLTGGAGADDFVFSTTPGMTRADRITDFDPLFDSIRLDDAVFAGLATGTPVAGVFARVTSGQPPPATARLIHDASDGKLYFDADGGGAGARVHFATISLALTLTAADFFVF